MTKYVSFLRGVNVGGKSLVSMSKLREALAESALQNVTTYIQSGNVLFESPETDTGVLSGRITALIKKHFDLDVAVATFSDREWSDVMQNAPVWWGADHDWKHNIIIMLDKAKPGDVLDTIGQLKPDVEQVEPGRRVVYQSLSIAGIGRAASMKIVGSAVYKKLTIRNLNTAHRLDELLNKN